VFNTGRGVHIPFLSRPYQRDHAYEIVPIGVLQAFDPLSVLNVGVFFVIASTIIMNNPSIFGETFGWIITYWNKGIVIPPKNLVTATYWFFMTMGFWGLALGVVRYLVKIHPIKSVQEILNGCFALVLGVLIRIIPSTMNGIKFYLSVIFVFFLLQIIFYLYYSRVIEISQYQ
jgi:hypothetical protein